MTTIARTESRESKKVGIGTGKKVYTIGVDFGTGSARAVLAETASGKVIADAVCEYPHGVMDRCIEACACPLPSESAFQDPQDYLLAFRTTVSRVIRDSGIAPEDILGVGIDFTSCTLLPVREDGTPLCFDETFCHEPQAYVKLWKHHAAAAEADDFNAALRKYAPALLEQFGGCTSCEWAFPKIIETLRRAPKVYQEAAYFIEAGDYLAWMLTGRQTRSYVLASYKFLYTPEGGFPPTEVFTSIDQRLGNIEEKLKAPLVYTGEAAGTVSETARARFGVPEGDPFLLPGTVVSCPEPDAHVAAPALHMTKEGDMFAIFGTSSNYMLISRDFRIIPGICGVVKDGLTPGFCAYESGLCCFGDHFAWGIKALGTSAYQKEADERGLPLIGLMNEKAAALRPGESGLLALNWWNGNRNILVDPQLSGLFIGMTLHTRPEEMYRALVEANAFGTRVILENFEKHGVRIGRLAVAGGISAKSPFVMQIMADVLGLPLHVSGYLHSSALGSAIYAAVAAGIYPSLEEACDVMADPCDTVYTPDPAAHAVYDRLYREYLRLHDTFGRGENPVMHTLRQIAAGSKA